MIPAISFSGLQGSGKSTQAELFIDRHLQELGARPALLAPGSVIREIANQEGPSQEAAQRTLKTGAHFPDERLESYVRDLVRRRPAEMYALDGFPRLPRQQSWIGDCFDVRTVYVLELPEDVAMQRLLERGRTDDEEAEIIYRFSLYWQDTVPTIAAYECVTIDALANPREVHEMIWTHFIKHR